MIKVIKNNNIITIPGHAGFSTYGKDIVCSSVSSIIYTTINALARLGKNIKVDDDKQMVIEYLSNDDVTLVLIDNMLCLLKELQNSYPKNIIVKEN